MTVIDALSFVFKLSLFFFLHCKSAHPAKYYDTKSNLVLLSTTGSNEHEGFLSILIENEWRSLCRKYWGQRNTKVVCRELGYTKALQSDEMSNSIDPSFLKTSDYQNFQYVCEGNEKSLEKCQTKKINRWVLQTNCRAEDRVYITCSPEKENDVIESKSRQSNFDVRLFSDGINQENILQVKQKDFWRNICHDEWTLENGFITCLQLGYPDLENYEAKTQTKSIDSYFEQRLMCSGNELTINECNTSKRNYSCKTGSVSLTCKMLDKTILIKEQIGELRLRGGYKENEGRVEVFRNGEWGTICDDRWDINDANVVCRQLGYGSAVEATHWADHGEGLGKIHFTRVDCVGNEANLFSCNMQLHKDQCTHAEDAGVRCHAPLVNDLQEIRLVNKRGESKNIDQGRIEVFSNGHWKSICGIGFTTREAQVVCKQLGLGFAKKGYSSYLHGVNYDKAMYNVKCHGNETRIRECSFDTYGKCRYYDMASVICSKYAPDLVMDISTFSESIKVESHPLYQLRCSFEENCLAPIVDRLYYQNHYLERHLLKFTSRFLNKGSVSFRPFLDKTSWQWHQCHKHYHSSEVFVVYDLIDVNAEKVAHGHKASFCLEDSDCEPGYMKVYNCANKGDQGISVNCADNYKNTLDCQWIDITDVPYGNYSLRVYVNPLREVAESDWLNNRAVCELHYLNGKVDVRGCSTDPCYQESFGGNAFGHCCHFPFVYSNQTFYECVDIDRGRPWCSTTYNYDIDRKWGFCSEKEGGSTIIDV